MRERMGSVTDEISAWLDPANISEMESYLAESVNPGLDRRNDDLRI